MPSPLRQVSIIIPTYNEAQNIKKILDSIEHNLPNLPTEAIVVDDNSPDGTADVVEHYRAVKKIADYTVNVIKRRAKDGLGSAILKGIENAVGDIIIVMDGDFSHPPNLIPKMIDTLKQTQCDLVVASRYVKGSAVHGWTFKRKLMSMVATKIAKMGLGIETEDPMSGFFAFKRKIIEGLKLDAIGYKMLLEILVKRKGITIKEIPYTFTNRKLGSSKLDSAAIFDYFRAVWKLYRYGKHMQKQEERTSVRFISKAARFFTVGASGLGVNYLVSLLFATSINLWYLHANILGIAFSMTSNFFLNKVWTFEDRNFGAKTTLVQYAKFVVFSSAGALVQLAMVYYLVDGTKIQYPLALILAVITAAASNFILNKKWTFKEKVWS